MGVERVAFEWSDELVKAIVWRGRRREWVRGSTGVRGPLAKNSYSLCTFICDDSLRNTRPSAPEQQRNREGGGGGEEEDDSEVWFLGQTISTAGFHLPSFSVRG